MTLSVAQLGGKRGEPPLPDYIMIIECGPSIFKFCQLKKNTFYATELGVRRISASIIINFAHCNVIFSIFFFVVALIVLFINIQIIIFGDCFILITFVK